MPRLLGAGLAVRRGGGAMIFAPILDWRLALFLQALGIGVRRK